MSGAGKPTCPSTPSKPKAPACVRLPTAVPFASITVISKKTLFADPTFAAPAFVSSLHALGGRTTLSSHRNRMPLTIAASERTPTNRRSHATPSLLVNTRSSSAFSSARLCAVSCRSRRA